MDEPRVRPDIGLQPQVLGNTALSHPEKQHVACSGIRKRLRDQPASGRPKQNFPMLRFCPVFGVGWHRFWFLSVKPAPHTTQQTKAIRSRSTVTLRRGPSDAFC